jgi:hypothetical protein
MPLGVAVPQPHNAGMRWILIALGLTLWAGALPAQEEAALRVEVRRLVEALDADTRGARLTAERVLLEMGPKVLPFLPVPSWSAPEPASRSPSCGSSWNGVSPANRFGRRG